MPYPNDVLDLVIDDLAVPQLIRNHSGHRGLIDWGAFGVSVVNSSAAGSFDGKAFRLTGAGIPGTSGMRSLFMPVTAGWKLELAFKAAVVTGTPTFTVSLGFKDAQGRTGVNVSAASTAADTTFTTTVPVGMAYVEVVIGRSSVATATVDMSRITLRQAATLPELAAAAPPESWLEITGDAINIDAEGGNVLSGVEDELEAGSLVATIKNASIDPAVNTTIRKGRRVVLSALVAGTRHYIFEGSLETADTDYDPEGRVLVTLLATDVARPLIDGKVSTVYDTTGAEQIQGVTRVLGIASFDGTQMPSYSTTTPLASADETPAATWIKRICNTALKRAWVDSRNVLQQRDVSALSTSPVATFSDTKADVGAIYYTRLPLNYGSRSCVNALGVIRFNLAEVFDNGAKTYGPYIASASEAANGRVEGTLEILSGSPSSYAAAVLPIFAFPSIFPREIVVNALDDLTKTLGVATYDAVRVKRTSILNKVVRVLRIKHEIRGDSWLTTFTPRPLETATVGVIVTNPGAGPDTGPAENNVILNSKPLSARERTTAATIPTATITKVNFPGVISSAGIPYDSTDYEFTVPRSGRYDIDLSVEWSAAGTGVRRAYIYVDNAYVKRNTVSASSSDNVTNTVTRSVVLNAGQKISARVFQNSGGNRSLAGDETNISVKYAD